LRFRPTVPIFSEAMPAPANTIVSKHVAVVARKKAAR
jgi:hypothetical protein